MKRVAHLGPGLCVEVRSPDVNVKAPGPSLLQGMSTIHNGPVHEVGSTPTLHASIFKKGRQGKHSINKTVCSICGPAWLLCMTTGARGLASTCGSKLGVVAESNKQESWLQH